MNQAQKPAALRLADRLSDGYSNLRSDLEPAASELRRLHARVQELENSQSKNERIGQHVSGIAKRLGREEDSGEGEFEYIQRLSYSQGLEDGARKRSEDVEREFHRHLVDVAWGECTESGEVPDTPWAERMIHMAKITFQADNERDHADEDAAIAAGKVQAAMPKVAP